MAFAERVQGMFLGLAIGDALGMPVEIESLESVAARYGRLKSYRAPAPDHRLHGAGMQAGMWTDDTQLALVVAESLSACGKLDVTDLGARHVAAMAESTNGWGRATRNAVERLATGAGWRESGEEGAAGNGVVMKLAPLIAFWVGSAPGLTSAELLKQHLGELCAFTLLTHRSEEALAATLAYAAALADCLTATPADFAPAAFGANLAAAARSARLTNQLFAANGAGLPIDASPLVPRLASLAGTDWGAMPLAEVAARHGRGSCRVCDSLPYALALFLRAPGSVEPLYDAASGGGDSDTNAALVGALLGALHGPGLFPCHLRQELWRAAEIDAAAAALVRVCAPPEPASSAA